MMNDCNVTIELDGDQRVEGGETVTGTILVRVNDDCTCNALTADLGWYAHGRGNGTSESVTWVEVFEGEWTSGKEHRYPFEIEVPPGPYTYRGHYLNVDWRLEASADIPWAIDPGDTRELVVEPDGSNEEYEGGEVGALESRIESVDDDSTISVAGVAFGGLFALAGGGVAWAGFSQAGANWMMKGFGLAFLAAGLTFIYFSIRNYFAEMRVGDVDVTLDPEEASPGHEVTCTVRLNPPQQVTLNKIELRWHGFEKVVSGHGTNKTTYTHTLYEETSVLPGTEQATLGGGAKEFQGRLTLPDHVPYSFEADDNKLRWEVEVKVDIPGWPDWKHAEPFVVRPAVEQTEEQTSGAEAGEGVQW
jgi:hypothetical protein